MHGHMNVKLCTLYLFVNLLFDNVSMSDYLAPHGTMTDDIQIGSNLKKNNLF